MVDKKKKEEKKITKLNLITAEFYIKKKFILLYR